MFVDNKYFILSNFERFKISRITKLLWGGKIEDKISGLWGKIMDHIKEHFSHCQFFLCKFHRFSCNICIYLAYPTENSIEFKNNFENRLLHKSVDIVDYFFTCSKKFSFNFALILFLSVLSFSLR